ncbi:MAG: ATP-binding protein [Candidatus Thorarchaeota archaeon]
MAAYERITYRITIDTKKCNGCNNCTTACPVNAALAPEDIIEGDDDPRVIAIKNGVAVVINPFRCDGDGICMVVCPQNCISLEFIPLEEYEDVIEQKTKAK